MRSVVFTLMGKRYGLYYNGMAMFEIQEQFGDTSAVFGLIRGRSKEKFKKLCVMIELLSVQYAKARVQMGYEKPGVLRAEYLESVAAIRDIALLQDVVIEAIHRGLEQEEIDEEQEIDLGLIEFQKKTANPG